MSPACSVEQRKKREDQQTEAPATEIPEESRQ
jgi:hypothetical protein